MVFQNIQDFRQDQPAGRRQGGGNHFHSIEFEFNGLTRDDLVSGQVLQRPDPPCLPDSLDQPLCHLSGIEAVMPPHRQGPQRVGQVFLYDPVSDLGNLPVYQEDFRGSGRHPDHVGTPVHQPVKALARHKSFPGGFNGRQQ